MGAVMKVIKFVFAILVYVANYFLKHPFVSIFVISVFSLLYLITLVSAIYKESHVMLNYVVLMVYLYGAVFIFILVPSITISLYKIFRGVR